MRKINIYPYNYGSRSVRALAKAIPAYRINPKRDKFIGNKGAVVNWGCSEMKERLLPEIMSLPIYNLPLHVGTATNKLKFFSHISKTNQELLPQWAKDIKTAGSWIAEGYMVVCRTILTGHSGKGIILARNKEELVKAPLYVFYTKKQDEYRVHVFSGKVIDIQRKARRRDIPDNQVDWRIRNHDNGFIYMREGINQIPYLKQMKEMAIKVVELTELDFGAVDRIYNADRGRLYVLEINTAPGLEGTTLMSYTEAMRRIK